MPDFNAIAEAVAARYAPGQVTPPAGLDNVRQATADLPQAITKTPVVLIYPDSGELAPGNGTRLGEHRFLARFYFGLTRNLERETNACRRWLTVLVDQHGAAAQLAGLVAVVRTVDWRIGQMDYAGKTYTGIELGLQVVTSEAWTPTA